MTQLQSLHNEVRHLADHLSDAQLREQLQDVDVYALGGSERLEAAFFDDPPPRLRHICFLGTGYRGFIDVTALHASSITLSCTPHANAAATAEFALTLALAGIRDLPALSRRATSGDWKFEPARSMHSATVGVLGFGHVGSRFAGLVRNAFHCRTLVWNRTDRRDEIEEIGATAAGMDQVLTDSDVISIHVDWQIGTVGHFLGAAELAQANSRLVLVNTSRATSVDPKALTEFLQTHSGARALFDGYYTEPVDRDSDPVGLLQLDNFTLTPHVAYGTDEATASMADMLLENVTALAKGAQPPYLVTP